MTKLRTIDPDLSRLIGRESERQRNQLTLIPSENHVSGAVRDAVGSVLMNKYAEGRVAGRYYQGNAVIDRVESLCQTRAAALFGLDQIRWGVNVQALSGSPANLAVFHALLAPGEKIMAMFLPDGGHLSHGWQLPGKKLTLASKIWDISYYRVDRVTRVLDYAALRRQALEIRPRLIVSGGTAYSREIDHKAMGEIAHEVGAYYLADIAHEAGLVAAGVCAAPFAHADIVTMTTHKTLRGPRGAIIFARRRPEFAAQSPAVTVDPAAAIDAAVFPGIQGGPHQHTIAGIAVALKEAAQPEFVSYARQTVKNARVLAEEFIRAGFDVVAGGTDKHLFLVDLRSVGISAWIAAWALEYSGIIVNRNTVPYETQSALYPSGLRFGTPAVSTRGMKEPEMIRLASRIKAVMRESGRFGIFDSKKTPPQQLKSLHRELKRLPAVKQAQDEVGEMTRKFPVP